MNLDIRIWGFFVDDTSEALARRTSRGCPLIQCRRGG